MYKSYFKIAWRNLTRNKSYALINIGGLTLALTVLIIIMLFVRHELSFDTFFENSDRTYRVLIKDNNNTMGDKVSISLPEPVIWELEELFPEVEAGVKYTHYNTNVILEGDNRFYSDGWATASEKFFEVFTMPFIAGDPASALSAPDNVVVTEQLALRLFESLDVIGRRITHQNENEYTVTGVIRDLPTNSHLDFEAIAGRSSLPWDQQPYSMWNMRMGNGYITLNSPDQLAQLKDKLPGYVEEYRNLPEPMMTSTDYELILQPVTDIHLYPMSREQASSRMIYIQILLIVAGLILLVACINYINLATARSADRAREIGIRKTLGAGRGQIMSQISLESIITCSIAFLASLILVMALRPVVLDYFDVHLSSLFTLSAAWIGILAAILLFIGMVSGSYAAFYLSSFRPSEILRGAGPRAGGSSAGFRKVLVVAQFGISIAIVIASLLVSRQMDFVRTERLDGNEDQVMVIHNNNRDLIQRFGTLKQELLQSNSVLSVTAGTLPNQISARSGYRDSTGSINLSHFSVAFDYLETMGLDLVNGRGFDPEMASDSSEAVILNETAARAFGYETAEGQEISRPSGRLIGIVEDFHETTLFDPIQPVVFQSIYRSGSYMRTLMVRLREGQISSGIEHVRATWNELEPAYPLNYSFLDQIMDQDYEAELRLAKIFNVFSGFAILIACLGLFGLAAFSAERRTREIGIRKVLGATVSHIVGLLSRDFVKLVAIGFLIAIPVAWYGADWWLTSFAYRIEIGYGIFLIAGVMALLIALLTVSWQSIRAALANPVDSLRSE